MADVAKGRAAPEPNDDALEVIELLAEDEPAPSRAARGTRPAGADRADADDPDPDDALRRSQRRRRLAIVAAVLVVALTAGLVARVRGGEPSGEVGISSEPRRDEDDDVRSSEQAADELRAAPNDWSPLRGRFALEIDGEPVVVDHMTGAISTPRALPPGGIELLASQAGAYLTDIDGDAYIVGRDGNIVRGAGWQVFPAVDGARWWAAQQRTVTPIVGDDVPFAAPNGFSAVAAVRDGFMLEADDDDDVPWLWSRGTEPRQLTPIRDISLVAVHPDRVAWQRRCPGDGCGLHVTEVVNGRDVVLPGVILPLFESGRVNGRFSPDGRYLALHVSTSLVEPGSFVLVDLTNGAIVARLETGLSLASDSEHAALRAVPFDFTPDGTAVVVAERTASGGSLRVVRTDDGGTEGVIGRVDGVTALASLERAPTVPSTPLLTERPASFGTGATLALASTAGDVLTLVDVDTGTQRVVELDYAAPTGNNDFDPRLVALERGFAWVRDGEGWFAPVDGTPVSLGPATYVMTGGSPSSGWIVHRAPDGYEITAFDGTTGTRSETVRSSAGPEGAVRDGVVIGRPASFTHGAEIEIWDPTTGDLRTVPINARAPVITAAGGTRVIWYDQACLGSSRFCDSNVTDTRSGRTDVLPGGAYTFSASATTPAGEVLYLQVQNEAGPTRLIAVELESMTVQDVPGSEQVEMWAASSRGVVVFQRDNAIHLWSPGRPTAEVLSPGGFGIVGGVALR
jgi:hypothetical protein